MSLTLSPEEAQEARQLIARLGVLLRERDAAQAPVSRPGGELADDDFAEASAALSCQPDDIRAVYAVESTGKPFGHDGRPVLLFEPHVFSRLTGHRYDATHGGVSYPKWGQKPYPRGSEAERHTANWDRLLYAARLDRQAAYQSASYGAPQIMGFNFKDAGHPDVDAFVAAMSRSAREQLLAFVSLILAWKLDDELREHRWVDFSRRYNGPGQVDTYAARLEAAYRSFA